MGKEKDVLDSVLHKPTKSDMISQLIADQPEDFPSILDVSVDEPFLDPFAIPKWCNTRDYAFSWVDLNDDIQRHRALEVGHFRIVTRMSSCILGEPSQRDFRTHGAVERQGMILLFRPKDLDDKLRTHAVVSHVAQTEAVSAGKQTSGYELTHLKYREGDHRPEVSADRSAKVEVVAYEDAGEPGIKKA
jgi:hypothetical protein